MAHFAKLDENNVVVDVVRVNNEVITVDGVESEQVGIDFLVGLFGPAKWVQTSYNNNFRKNYAVIGGTYDPDLDAFIPFKPYPSWVFDRDLCNWIAPVLQPTDPNLYTWDEPTLSWKLVATWDEQTNTFTPVEQPTEGNP